MMRLMYRALHVCHIADYIHPKNWSVKNNSWSVIFNTSQECEEVQHSECYTNTSWGVAILTLRKFYRDLTIRSVYFNTSRGLFRHSVKCRFNISGGLLRHPVTPSTGRTDTTRVALTHFMRSLKTGGAEWNTGFSEHMWAQSNTLQAVFFYNTLHVYSLCGFTV